MTVQTLLVTLKRSLAGTRESHIRILQSLGLHRRQQTVEKPNNAAIRGAINKVSGRACTGTWAAPACGRGAGAGCGGRRVAPGAPSPANSPTRPALQVKHLVTVETDLQQRERLAAEAAAAAPRPPLRVRHTLV